MERSTYGLHDLWGHAVGLIRVHVAVVLLRLRESQWLLALIGSLIGFIVGYIMVRYNAAIAAAVPGETWVTSSSEARSILLAFIGVEITALSIVMSLTMITVQSASSQFSSRLIFETWCSRAYSGLLRAARPIL